ncbi:MAG: cytochrome c1 [Rhodobacteraceae bacterium]|nr:cytochrome c1 [Paracoccaceae bacterium]
MRKTLKTRAAAGAAVLALTAAPSFAAGGGVGVIDHDWSFEGPFGTFDKAELQRGWQVYSQVCSSCHSMEYLHYRDLSDPNGPALPPEQVKAMAAEFEVEVGPDSEGEMFTRPAILSDKLAKPFPNKEAAMSANGGAYPPDLTLITKARTGYTGIIKQMMEGTGGVEYVYSLMLGYTEEPPEGFDVGDLSYNKYFPGHLIAMGQPLYGDDVEYQDGTEATIEQQAHDLVAFLAWAAEPQMVERKQAGLRNIILLIIFGALVWYSNKKLWKPIKEGGEA